MFEYTVNQIRLKKDVIWVYAPNLPGPNLFEGLNGGPIYITLPVCIPQ